MELVQMDQQKLIPAHAGVIPSRKDIGLEFCAYPRARGGDPLVHQGGIKIEYLSPRTRG